MSFTLKEAQTCQVANIKTQVWGYKGVFLDKYTKQIVGKSELRHLPGNGCHDNFLISNVCC